MDVQRLLTQIRGGAWKAPISQLQNESDPERAESLKKALQCFTASCTTNGGHKSADVIAHSGLLQVDVDKIGMEAAERLRDALQGEPCAFAAWLSPSGNGLKILVRVPDDISRHAESFAAVEKHFLEKWEVKIDPSCKDVSRLCFVSHDPDLWINPDAEIIDVGSVINVGTAIAESVTGGGREYFLEKAENPPLKTFLLHLPLNTAHYLYALPLHNRRESAQKGKVDCRKNYWFSTANFATDGCPMWNQEPETIGFVNLSHS